MITVKELRKFLEDLPDDVEIMAYEGEGVGLRVSYNDKYGWIETGDPNVNRHDLKDIVKQ